MSSQYLERAALSSEARALAGRSGGGRGATPRRRSLWIRDAPRALLEDLIARPSRRECRSRRVVARRPSSESALESIAAASPGSGVSQAQLSSRASSTKRSRRPSSQAMAATSIRWRRAVFVRTRPTLRRGLRFRRAGNRDRGGVVSVDIHGARETVAGGRRGETSTLLDDQASGIDRGLLSDAGSHPCFPGHRALSSRQALRTALSARCRIRLHFIPAYCPHLNPIERLCGRGGRMSRTLYGHCQFADTALGFCERFPQLEAIRYASIRNPGRGMNLALMHRSATPGGV